MSSHNCPKHEPGQYAITLSTKFSEDSFGKTKYIYVADADGAYSVSMEENSSLSAHGVVTKILENDTFMPLPKTSKLTPRTPIKPAIIFDIDGVLADFTTSFRELAHTIDPAVKLSGAPEQLTWEYEDLPEPLQKKTWAAIYKNPIWWSKLTCLVCPTTRKEINLLSAEKEHPIMYVTARPPWKEVQQATFDWLLRNGMPTDPIYFRKNKAAVARAMGAGFVIDDSPANLNVYAPLVDEGVTVFGRAWAYNVDVDPRVRRGTLEEFLGLIRGHNEGKDDNAAF